MSFKRLKRKIRKKNLTPMNNRKKVGVILFATSIGLFFLFAVRMIYVVAGGHVAGTSLKVKTEELYHGGEVVKAKRGTIFDRNGEVIAEDATSYSIYAILSESYVNGNEKLYAQEKNFDDLASILNKYLGIKEKSALKTLKSGLNSDGTSKYYQVEFGNKGKNISEETKQNIEDAMKKDKVKGLYFTEHTDRMYPNGNFASHFIGYAQPDKKESLVGMMGVEAAYDDVLKGKDGKVVYQKDENQRPIPGSIAEEKKAVNGEDIYTTLDAGLQSYLETLMDKVSSEAKPTEMTAMLMQAKTGDILAMSQRPTFNPETKEGLGEEDAWRNFLVEDSYEPGSTMKVFTTSAAVNEGIFNENESYVSGKIQVADATINDWDLGKKGILTMRQALSWSSNVGMVKLEERLGDRWPEYVKRFGFGQSTYSGLPGETKGTLPTINIVDQAMSSYGQAIGVTNFQMMRGFTAVANDGKMLQPHYIEKVSNPDTGKEIITKPEVVGEPITAETAQKVREYMRDTVESENYGSAYDQYKVPGYHISAKTGTAQIAENGRYLTGDTNYIYSIALMIPSEDPEYILYLTMKQPQEKQEGILGEIANPLLSRVMEFQNTETDSSEEESNTKVTVEDYRNLSTSKAAADANKRGLTAVVIGDGDKVIEQSAKPGEKVMANEHLILLTNGKKEMPDVRGWSKADILKLTNLLDIDVSFKGDGYCTKQSIAPYAEVSKKKLKITLG
ncbi:penicillin-binding transpeptidase domain-containing protein [Enterococcus avium]|uniref:penicillin-binding transpeptidase domain-containing protein n=1 Tax=Enterococcus avium TaxID=33945 RepID=UPI00288E05CC|nr:penicillin-binding transpeptidase domain-containing protein [Enterococcus avium]MDT2399939.1 penicillin-binding transpeptidase domain-containing protein [Enterococcus avium]MDT2436853.1 penicillin-binding transpeptidase domain-containing protein [Enterococcus avium]MDT2450534.1 penicillin-binding transpeptidase domain-containing protein [Enterococcus avium]MDT2466952.1 penicillin-binding transpeptidase domain-containing protein [Enterococcus avium]MDT2485202.1 penicillin-binding transpeptid